MSPPLAVYQGLFRRLGPFVGALPPLLLIVAGGFVAMIRSPESEGVPMLVASVGVFLIGLAVSAMACFRVHRWELHADRLEISERPKFRLLGRAVRANVPLGRIVAMRAAKSGLDDLIEIITPEARVYRLKQTMGALPEMVSGIDPHAGVAGFASRIQEAMRAAGLPPPPIVQRLGFLETPAGLVLVALLLVLSLALAGVVGWMLWDGFRQVHRIGDALAVIVLLPIALAYLLRRAWLRRRAVLAGRPGGSANAR